MTHWRRHLTITLLAVSTASLLVRAQSGRKIPKPENPILRIETREVLLPVNAFDADGQPVTDLSTTEIVVVENGAPRLVTSLRREPASIVLVLDLSNEIGTFKNGSSGKYFPEETKREIDRNAPVWKQKYDIVPNPAAREFAENFIKRLGDGDHLAIVQYSDKVQLIQDWTTDRASALEAVRSKYRVGLKAKYFDALALAAAKLNERRGRRVMVLLSDGLDTASKTSQSKSVSALERTGASIFVVGWDEVIRSEITRAMSWMGAHERHSSSLVKRLRELERFLFGMEAVEGELRSMAAKSGGEKFNPASFAQLTSKMPVDLHRELGAQYSLAFVTEQGTTLETERYVEVLVGRPGVSIRTRRAYTITEESTR